MRLLYSASFIIMLIDMLTKKPIKDAVILCNGKQNPYVSKDDGYYVFCNLSPGSYSIFISASGYINKEFDTSLEFGESKKFIFFLSFQSNNSRLLNVPRIEFLIKKDNQILKNKEVKFISKTSQMIKMIQKIKKGEQEVILNVPENNFFIFQNFIYSAKCDEKNEQDEKDQNLDDEVAKLEAELNDLESDEEDKKKQSSEADKNKDKKENKSKNQSKFIKNLLFIGYDRKFNAYILNKETDIEIPVGGNFYPYWNLQTDSKGKVTIPFSQKLINDGFIIFEISCDNYMVKRKVNLKRMNMQQNILRVRINFKDED